jgi:transcriptional regulator with PAS, ATPase and Fis domain
MNDDLSILGQTPAVVALRENILFAARSDAKVLISGESGVGKELVSRLVHSQSRRASWPLVTVNCAAIAETLLESELFGHARGSFTGAYRDRVGLLERAHRGSVFMDEVGETSPRMQGLLLRFLETGEIQPVGSDRAQTRVDVRVIAATNRVLIDRVAAGEFREDLFYRLNVIHLTVPPLRERRGDVPVLLEHFLRSFADQYGTEVPRLSQDAIGAFLEHDWPGNVRELKNVVERLVIAKRSGQIERGDIPIDAKATSPHQPSGGNGANGGSTAVAVSQADALFEDIVTHGQSFWAVVYAPFMSRDLTRRDVRLLITKGLERTCGDYRALTRLFNMAVADRKRFVAMLRKYHCHVPPQGFRTAPHRSLTKIAG